MLVVAVSLGWGIVQPTLGSHATKLILLGALYFIFESALEIVQRYSQSNSIADHWRLGLIIPVSILNSLFYWWMFLSLQRLIGHLDSRKQYAKLSIYKKFAGVLILSLVLAVMYAMYQIYYASMGQDGNSWQKLWLLDQGIPLMIYTIVLVSISVLFLPSENSRAYAYSQLGSVDEMEMDAYDMDTEGEEDSNEESDDDDNFATLHGGVAPKFSISDDEDENAHLQTNGRR
jgi:hypothetical protein